MKQIYKYCAVVFVGFLLIVTAATVWAGSFSKLLMRLQPQGIIVENKQHAFPLMLQSELVKDRPMVSQHKIINGTAAPRQLRLVSTNCSCLTVHVDGRQLGPDDIYEMPAYGTAYVNLEMTPRESYGRYATLAKFRISGLDVADEEVVLSATSTVLRDCEFEPDTLVAKLINGEAANERRSVFLKHRFRPAGDTSRPRPFDAMPDGIKIESMERVERFNNEIPDDIVEQVWKITFDLSSVTGSSATVQGVSLAFDSPLACNSTIKLLISRIKEIDAPAGLDFGPVPLHEVQSKRFVVRSEAGTAFTISAIDLKGDAGFSCVPQPHSAKAFHTLEVQFVSKVAGLHKGELTLKTLMPDGKTVAINIELVAGSHTSLPSASEK
ncbi:unnamed protein product [Gemmata massiliana]|uniref:DUF1573 domain-containing protein n=1 Tax=Gemmata massiliana TaxID=1210884 RepID=A0A6P2CYA4_9BACT|nr:hypothetical protein [Gemmata massiliana]VTR93095.1 unnamed protein product [Gemmata massiliana]